jgi:predicted transcriptional regulator
MIFSRIYGHMKTTVDLPDALLQRVKIAAAHRRTTLKKLVIEGLEHVLGSREATASARAEALARLRQGLHLDGQPLSREAAHERKLRRHDPRASPS